MPSPFAIIGTAWQFNRKHPVLNAIAFWFFFAPSAIFETIFGLMGTASGQGLSTLPEPAVIEALIFGLPVFAVILYFFLWGYACLLHVAKRMLGSEAGRKRTSFAAVRRESRKFILPLFTISIIRSAMTLLWSLLLIIPGVIYSIRTIFYDIVLVSEGKVVYGRKPLEQSKKLVLGNTWEVLLRVIVFGLCIMFPAWLLEVLTLEGLTALDERLETLGIILATLIDSYAFMLFALCNVALFAELKKGARTTVISVLPRRRT